MKKLSIALPGLLWHDAGDLEYLITNTPNFDKLIKRGAVHTLPYSFSDLVYSNYAGTTTSLAAEIAKMFKYENLYPHFLLAEPTFLRADRDRLLICESELLQLNDDEVYTIINKLNNYFAGILQVFVINTNLWLIGLNQEIRGDKFYPILDIIGENIDDYLSGNDVRLAKLLNEIQMLLFGLELNKQRKQEGLIQVNSLWLWDKAIKFNLIYGYSNIFTNSQSINNAKIKRLPKSLVDAFIHNSLIIIDSLYYPCSYRDKYSYLHNLSVIDAQVMSLLHEHKTRFNNLEILIPGACKTLVITLNKNNKYKFWKKKLTFSQLLKEQNAF